MMSALKRVQNANEPLLERKSFCSGTYIYYAYTIKRLAANKESCDYVFKKWNKMGILLVLRQHERDSKNKLHYHGIVRAPKNFVEGRFQSLGYHVYTKAIQTYSDYTRWNKYCHKNQLHTGNEEPRQSSS